MNIPALPQSAHIDASVADNAAPWLDSYIEFSKIWSPSAYDGYHEAVGLWVMSTVAARRAAYAQGKLRFPSLYIALLGRTSIWTKTTTAEIGAATIKSAGLSYLLAPDEMTPQAFVEYLSDDRLPKSYDTMPSDRQRYHLMRVAFAGQKAWFYDEFGQKVSGMMKEGGHMADYRSLLRSFDDARDGYEYRSISRGVDTVQNPYLSMLTSMTPADLAPYGGTGAPLWNDGFWARWAFVAPEQGAERKRGRFPEEQRKIPVDLVALLMKWNDRLGEPQTEIIPDEDEKKCSRVKTLPVDPTVLTFAPGVYDAFYTYRDALLDLLSGTDQTDLDGNYSRLPEKGMRIAALLASLQGCEQIEMRHWARAQQIAERWRVDLHALYDQLTGTVEHSKKVGTEEAILRLVAREGGNVSKRDICRKLHIGSEDAETILPAMTNTGRLTVIIDKGWPRYSVAG